jgi:parallel beta-helix repeat protein
MADNKISAFNPMTTPVAADVLPIVDDPAGSDETQKITFADLQTGVLSLHRHAPTVIVASDGSGDFIDIQDGIDDLPAGGGLVFIKNGTYTLSATLTIAKSNVTIVGQGDATIITLANTANVNVFTLGNGIDSFENIILRDFKIDGNQANQGSNGYGINIMAHVSRVIIQGIHSIETKDNSIKSDQDSNYLTIQDCLFGTNSGQILVGYCHHTHILNNIFDSDYYAALNIQNSNYLIISGNYLRATKYLMATTMSVYLSACLDAIVTNNYILGNPWYQINILDSHRCLIEGNNINGGNSDGIMVNSSDDCKVLGNTIMASNGGISICQSDRCTVVGNNITSIVCNGIILTIGTYCIIKGNNITATSNGTNNGYDAITMIGDCIRNIISGNNIYSAEVKLPKYGIDENYADCDYNLIQGNNIVGVVTAAIRVQGAHTLVDTNLI